MKVVKDGIFQGKVKEIWALYNCRFLEINLVLSFNIDLVFLESYESWKENK